MEEKKVSYQIAKLAFEKGFDWPCHWIVRYSKGFQTDYYDDAHSYIGCLTFELEDTFNASENTDEPHYLAPEQGLLQKWLRDVHGFHIDIFQTEDPPYDKFYYREMKIGQYFTLSIDHQESGTYEEALENGLVKCLNRIV